MGGFFREFIPRSVRFSPSPLSPSSSFRSSRHIVVLIIVSFFLLSFIFFVYFVLLYIYDLLVTVILLAPSCFVRLLRLYELLCWIEFSIIHLLPSSPEYYTERQHPQDLCVAITSGTHHVREWPDPVANGLILEQTSPARRFQGLHDTRSLASPLST